MKLLAVAVGMAAAVAAGSLAAFALSGGTVGVIRLTGLVTEHHATYREATFPGRETWYLSLVSQRARGKKFGYGVLSCQFVSDRNTLRNCAGTFSLPLGRIMVAGSFLYAGLFDLAVTGGTDTYLSASGDLLGQRVGTDTYELDFHLH